MTPISDRPTGDLLLLMVAFTVCFSVLAAGAAVAVVEIRDPSADTSGAAATLRDVLGTLVGLLAGYCAARLRAPGDGGG